MTRGLTAVLLAAALGACSFESATPFFTRAEGASPFQDGARYDFMEHEPGAEENEDSEIPRIEFLRQGGAYKLIGNDRDDAPIGAIFVALNDTPEEDYIVEIAMDSNDAGRTYVFIWRSGGAYKVIFAPGDFLDTSAGASAFERLCVEGQFRSCTFANREALIAFYREAIYPTFVAPDVEFHGLGYLVPANTP